MGSRTNQRKKALKDYKLVWHELLEQQEYVRKLLTLLKKDRSQLSYQYADKLQNFLNLQDYIVRPTDIDLVAITKVAKSASFIEKELTQMGHTLEEITSTVDEWRHPLEEKRMTFTSVNFDDLYKSVNLSQRYKDKAHFFLMRAAMEASTQDLDKNLLSKSVAQAKEEYESTRDALSYLRQKSKEVESSITSSLEYEEGSEEIMDHYTALADAQISSNNLLFIASVLEKEKDVLPEKGSNNPLGIWDKIKYGWETVKEKIKHIKGIFYGSLNNIGKSLMDGLDKLKDSFAEGKERIQEAFKSVSEKFQQLIMKIINSMLGFLSSFRTIVKEKGYTVSSIEITIPSIKFEFKNIFGIIPIPLPQIEPPGLTVTIEPTVVGNQSK